MYNRLKLPYISLNLKLLFTHLFRIQNTATRITKVQRGWLWFIFFFPWAAAFLPPSWLEYLWPELHGLNDAGRAVTSFMIRPRHGLINYKDTRTKCRHLKKLTWKGTLRRVFIRVYRLDHIQSVRLVFSTQLCELLPLLPSLWFTYKFFL